MALIIGGVANDDYETPKIHLWDLDLTNYSEFKVTGPFTYGSNSLKSQVVIDTNRNEVWIGCSYDAVHCFDSITGAYKTTVQIYPLDTWWESYSLNIQGDYLYVTFDDYKIHKINLNNRTVISSTNIYGTARGYGLNSSPTHLIVNANQAQLQKYLISDMSYIESYSPSPPYVSIYYNSGFYFDGHVYCAHWNIPGAVIKYNIASNTATIYPYGTRQHYQVLVDETNGNIYSVIQEAVTGYAVVAKFDSNFNYLGNTIGTRSVSYFAGMCLDSANNKLYVIYSAGYIDKIDANTLITEKTSFSESGYSGGIVISTSLPISSILMYKFRPVVLT